MNPEDVIFAANHGVKEVQTLSGIILLYGWGCKADAESGIRLLKAAAGAGDGMAAYFLARYFIDNEKLDEINLGKEFLEKSASLEFSPAQLYLATCLRSGQLWPVDNKKAVMWMEKAANQGLVEAMDALSVAFSEGATGKPDLDAAMKWAEEAASKGSQHSRFWLASSMIKSSSKSNVETGMRILNQLTEEGFWAAHGMLALAYRHGLYGLSVDHSKADFYEKESSRLAEMHAANLSRFM